MNALKYAIHCSWKTCISMTIVIVVSLLCTGCNTNRATPADCRAIFDRLVALELKELGFLDPHLAALRQTELSKRFEPQLAACVGKAISPTARQCVSAATDSEALSHNCLR